MKESIKAPRHWPLWEEFTGDWWIPRTKGQQRGNISIWWRHHAHSASQYGRLQPTTSRGPCIVLNMICGHNINTNIGDDGGNYHVSMLWHDIIKPCSPMYTFVYSQWFYLSAANFEVRDSCNRLASIMNKSKCSILINCMAICHKFSY